MWGVLVLMVIIVLLLGRIASNQIAIAKANRDNTKAIMESIAYWGKKISE